MYVCRVKSKQNHMTTNNPFEVIDQRLANIENLLFSMKQDNKRPQEDPEKLMTIQQAAEFLSLSVPTLYTKISREKDFPHMKRGKRLYFLRGELLKYLKGNDPVNFKIK